MKHPTTPHLAILGLLLVSLAVARCGTGTSEPAEIGAPVAVISYEPSDVELLAGDTVTLDGSSSHLGENAPEHDLTFSWQLAVVPVESALGDADILLADEQGTGATFTPDIEGIYEIHLKVSDGSRDSITDAAVLQVGGTNHCPDAHAGPDRAAVVGQAVELDGSASSDPDLVAGDDDDDDSAAGDDDSSAEPEFEDPELVWRWHFSLVPSNSTVDDSDFYGQGSPAATFIPDVIGTYIVQLVVDDGVCQSTPDYVTIQVSGGDGRPVADAGGSQLLTPCAPSRITLDGTGSFDPEGAALDFRWTFTGVPPSSDVSDALIEDRFSATPSFVWDVPGVYTVELIVSDGNSDSEPDHVALRAVPSMPNAAPQADADDDVVVEAAAYCVADAYTAGTCDPCGSRSVVVSAAGSSDPDGDPLYYQWSILSESFAVGQPTLLGDDSEAVEVILPEVPVDYGSTVEGTVELGLTVYDCRSADSKTVSITLTCDGDP